MEILFFLAILVLQFAYQIHLAVKKRKARQQSQEEENPSETQDSFTKGSAGLETEARYEPFEETVSPSQVSYANYANYADANHGNTEKEEMSEVKNFYNQLFGFTEDRPEPWPPSHSPNPEKEEVFAYDTPLEEGVRETRTIGEKGEKPAQKIEETALPRTSPRSIQNRIRAQLRNPQTQRDAWRVKFILDTPPGLSTNRDLF